MGKSKIDWSKWDCLLTKKTIKELASLIGCSKQAINWRKAKLGLAKQVPWANYDILLGQMTDVELAEIIGCSSRCVGVRRNKLNIPEAQWTNEDQELIKNNLIKCLQCGIVKPTLEFCVCKKNKRTGRHRNCKNCRSKKQRNLTMTLKSNYINLMGGACCYCGYNEHITPLQFHHITSKKYQVSHLMTNKDAAVVIKELDKCCLLCSNCHDAYHGGEIEMSFIKKKLGWAVEKERREVFEKIVCD